MYTAGSGYAEARHGKHSTPHLLGQKGRATQDAPQGAHTRTHTCRSPRMLDAAVPSRCFPPPRASLGALLPGGPF